MDKKVESLLHDDLGEPDRTRWRLFAYDSSFSELDDNDEILPGRSYWLRTRDFDASIDMNDVTVRTLPISRAYSVPLHDGWNCLSNPFLFKVNPAGTMMDDTEVQHMYVYKEDEWQTNEDISYLTPWEGFLVWNGESRSTLADSIQIAPDTYDASAAKVSSGGGVRIGVRVASGDHRDGRAVMAFGYAGSGPGRDGRDHPKPVIFPKPLNISMIVDGAGEQPYLTDYRGELGEGQGWRFRVRNESRGSTLLEFFGLEGLPEETGAVFLDKTSGEYKYLRSPVLKYSQVDSVEDFEVHIGGSEYLEERVREFVLRFSKFYLGQNYPNPVSSATTIGYSIPGSRNGGLSRLPVRLEVYDIMGRSVITLVRESQDPGRYTVRWPGVDSKGRRVPGGAYIYMLRVGNKFEDRKKMLLLR
jgi:hypothetical protein